jgi:transposase-like protein
LACASDGSGEAADRRAPGMSVARVAQAEGVNSHQMFQWRRVFRVDGLCGPEREEGELQRVVLTDGARTRYLCRDSLVL